MGAGRADAKGLRVASRDHAAGATRSMPSSWSPEARTLDICLASSTPCMRQPGWSDPYWEILSMSPGSVRLDRINNGAPVLLQHAGYNANALLGSFVPGSAHVEGMELMATVQFVGEDTAVARGVEPFIQEIAAGHRCKWSVGYDIHDYREIGKADDGVMQVECIDWEPLEGSSVLIPADDTAHSRAHEPVTVPSGTTPRQQQEARMDPETPITPVTPAPVVDVAAVERAAAERAAAETHERHQSLLTSVRRLKLDIATPEVAAILGDGKRSLADAREALFEIAAKRDDAPGIQGAHGAGVEIGVTELDHKRTAMADYLYAKRFGTPIEGRARDYIGFRWFDVGRECLEMQGVKTRGIDPLTLAGKMLHVRDSSGAMGTSHFPFIVAAVTGKSLAKGYGIPSQHYKTFSARRTPPDLRLQRELFVDSVGDLSAVNEFGDYTYTTMTEGQETWQLVRRGKMVKITPELILNDDLGAITTAPQKLGEAAARTREKVFWTRVQAATAMADGQPVYHATHGNLITASGGAPTWARICAMQVLMDAQTDRSGELVALQLDRFAFPPVHREAVSTLWTKIAPTQQSAATPEELYSLGKTVTPHLTGNPWYGFVNPEIAPAFVHGELEGRSGPTVEDDYDFDSSCLKIKVEDYFGIGAVDHRPTVKQPGA